MKTADIEKFKTLEGGELPHLAKVVNIDNVSYVPVGHVITLQKEFEEAPSAFEENARESVVGTDHIGNKYYITPNHIKGEIYVDGTYKRINMLYNGTLQDFLSTMPRVRLAEFKKVEVDNYKKSGKTIKNFPIYELVE